MTTQHFAEAAKAFEALMPAGPNGKIEISDIDPEVYADADRDALAAIRALQAANRNRVYNRQRPAKYAEACYAALTEHQTQGGKVERWWDAGPRAVVFAGPSRTGKTTAAYAITNDVQTRNQWVVVRTAADLSAALKPDSGEPLAYQHAIECDLLLIDDLGRERVTDWWLEQLQRIADARCANGRRLITTTNHGDSIKTTYDDLANRYGYPLVERLIDDGAVLFFDGPTMRNVVREW